MDEADNRITQNELAKMFGATMPLSAFKLLFEPNGMSEDEVRARLKPIGAVWRHRRIRRL